MQCFRRATYRTRVFNMACAGACECDRMPFLSRPTNESCLALKASKNLSHLMNLVALHQILIHQKILSIPNVMI